MSLPCCSISMTDAYLYFDTVDNIEKLGFLFLYQRFYLPVLKMMKQGDES